MSRCFSNAPCDREHAIRLTWMSTTPPDSPKPPAPPPGATPPATEPGPAAGQPLTPEEQMALYEKELKETDWGHQPC